MFSSFMIQHWHQKEYFIIIISCGNGHVATIFIFILDSEHFLWLSQKFSLTTELPPPTPLKERNRAMGQYHIYTHTACWCFDVHQSGAILGGFPETSQPEKSQR